MQSHFGKRLKVLLSAGALSGVLGVSAGIGGTLGLIQPALAQDAASLVAAIQAAQGDLSAIQAAINTAIVNAVNGSPGGPTAANAQSVAATIIAMFSGPAAPYPGIVSAADLGGALASAGVALGPAAAGGIALAVTATGNIQLAGAYTANGGLLAGNDGTATGATPGGNPPNLPSLLSSLNSGSSTSGLTTGGGSTSLTPSPSAPF